MRQAFRIFFRTELVQPWLVLLALTLGGFLEAIGIGTLLPVAKTLGSGEISNGDSTIERAIAGFVAWLGQTPSFGLLVGLVLTFYFLRCLILFFTMTYVINTGAQVTINLRRRLLRALFNAKWSFYGEQSSGHIANAMGLNATQAGIAFQTAAQLFTFIPQVIAYCLIALMVDARTALVGLLGGGCIALFSGWLVRLTRKHAHKQVIRIGTISAELVDLLQNLKALKSMQRYDGVLARLESHLVALRRSLFMQGFTKFGLQYGNDMIIALLVGLGAIAAFYFGHRSLPELTVLGLLFYQVVNSVAKMQKSLQENALFESSYTSVYELIKEVERAQEINTGTIAPDIGSGCKFQNVSFSHGDRPTVHNISFDIPRGKITILQGPSGAGKTTIVDLLTGFHRPQGGRILVGKDDLSDVDLVKWRSRIGYVPQELILFHDSIRANITLADDSVSDEKIKAAFATAGLAGFIASLPQGLDTDVGEYGGKLSGGQRQRISLARALVHDPELLILDEVTSALDPSTESAIIDSIEALRGQYTIVAITHRPAWTQVADRLYEVGDGTVKAIKTARNRKQSA